MQKKLDRRGFLKVLCIGGVVFTLEKASFGKPANGERIETQIQRLCDTFPDADQIPGAGRVDKAYVEDSQHLLIRIDQGPYDWCNLHPLHDDHIMDRVRSCVQGIEHVQEDIVRILRYLVENDSDNTLFFPRNDENQRVIYAQRMNIISTLNYYVEHFSYLASTEMRDSIPLPNASSKRSAELQEYIKTLNEQNLLAAYALRDESNMSVQDIDCSCECIEEFSLGTPVVTAIYSISSPADITFDTHGNKSSLIEIIPEIIARED